MLARLSDEKTCHKATPRAEVGQGAPMSAGTRRWKKKTPEGYSGVFSDPDGI